MSSRVCTFKLVYFVSKAKWLCFVVVSQIWVETQFYHWFIVYLYSIRHRNLLWCVGCSEYCTQYREHVRCYHSRWIRYTGLTIGRIHHQNIVLTFLGYIYWIYMDLFLNAVCFPQKMAMLARTRRCPNLARPQKQGKLLALTHGLLYLWFICDHFYISRSISHIFLSFLFFLLLFFKSQLLTNEIISQSGWLQDQGTRHLCFVPRVMSTRWQRCISE